MVSSWELHHVGKVLCKTNKKKWWFKCLKKAGEALMAGSIKGCGDRCPRIYSFKEICMWLFKCRQICILGISRCPQMLCECTKGVTPFLRWNCMEIFLSCLRITGTRWSMNIHINILKTPLAHQDSLGPTQKVWWPPTLREMSLLHRHSSHWLMLFWVLNSALLSSTNKFSPWRWC